MDQMAPMAMSTVQRMAVPVVPSCYPCRGVPGGKERLAVGSTAVEGAMPPETELLQAPANAFAGKTAS